MNKTKENKRVTRVQIYDMEEAIRASGLPMAAIVEDAIVDYERAEKLGTSEMGMGHGNYLTGITVAFDLKLTHAMLPQFQRYHFAQIVSSQSKMHRILSFNLDEQCHELVDPRCFEIVKDAVALYKASPTRENYQRIIYSAPIGLELTMRVNTNYMQLMTMYFQRKEHRLDEWTEFCDWIKSLKFMDVLIGGIERKREETLRIKIANPTTTFLEQFDYVRAEVGELAEAFIGLKGYLDKNNMSFEDLEEYGQNGAQVDHLIDRVRSETVDVSRVSLKLVKDHLMSDKENLQGIIYSEDKKNGFKGYYDRKKESEE